MKLELKNVSSNHSEWYGILEEGDSETCATCKKRIQTGYYCTVKHITFCPSCFLPSKIKDKGGMIVCGGNIDRLMEISPSFYAGEKYCGVTIQHEDILLKRIIPKKNVEKKE